jgi:hypothetical protein
MCFNQMDKAFSYYNMYSNNKYKYKWCGKGTEIMGESLGEKRIYTNMYNDTPLDYFYKI